MNKIEKYLSRLSHKDRVRINEVIDKLRSGNVEDLQIKKLGGYKDRFRIRVGRSRVIFESLGNKLIITDIDKKDDNTYKF
jgi:mRNA-degrading endonuclease RelE of RelBE toxin-antitoxin system